MAVSRSAEPFLSQPEADSSSPGEELGELGTNGICNFEIVEVDVA